MLEKDQLTEAAGNVHIAIVDDNDTIREGLVELINASDGYSCIGAYRSAEAALAEIAGKRPDVILMDINMPGMSGIECTRRMKSLLPHVQIMMLTVYENDEHVFSALKAGATGYLVKRTTPDKLLAAITELREGGSPMSAEIARKIVQTFHDQQAVSAQETETLTKREREILGYLAKGLRYKEIAEKLFISASTVRTHIHKVYEKLHVRSKSEAILKVLRR